MKLRVLMIGQFAKRKGENDGGVSAVMSYLSAALLERNDVELVGARIGAAIADDSTDEQLGFPIHNIATRPLGLVSGFRSQLRRLDEIVKQTVPDIVHGQGADVAGFLASRSGRPAIVTVHGIIGQDARFKSNSTERLRDFLTSWFIEKPLIRSSTPLILISPYVAEYYGDSIRGEIYDVPNPVGQEYFDLTPCPQSGRVLYAGRVIPRKGILDLVSAFALLRQPADRRLMIAGSLSDTPYVEKVKTRIRELGIEDRVELPGLLRDTELLSEFARAQMLVLPSFQETAPMVILQAMAGGLPIVATRICGVPYQVSDGDSGLLYKPGEIVELHGHLNRLIADHRLASRMGDAGRNVARSKFHAKSVAAATVNAYRSTVAKWAQV